MCSLWNVQQIAAAHKLLQDIFHGDTVQTQDNSSETVFEVQPQFMKLLKRSDITDERVDAIVNAANERLQHGGGVAAAIVRKGGRQIEDESRRIMSDRNRRSLDVGDAVHTSGGHLPCRFVIHTVGPVWKEREGKKCVSLLRRACIESLRLAAQLELCSIALPAISSGIFGMPKNICAQVMFDAVEEFSSSTEAEFSTLRDVRVVIIDDETISFFREEFVRRYTSQDTSSSPTNLTALGRPSGEKQESSPTSNSSVKYPSISSSERVANPSDGPPKESRVDNDNASSPNKEVGRT
ncbi:ADP-D-ribose binding [Desmophyllum pertusum]|uniref:ADP-D-ribose binding n=1 Tax=Desmophyllum pertusum TaxID=174260 RepID=A0A9W9Z3M9_9CNID|nr:ADP-D-ribose binding [Desmophyllum pertusum]